MKTLAANSAKVDTSLLGDDDVDDDTVWGFLPSMAAAVDAGVKPVAFVTGVAGGGGGGDGGSAAAGASASGAAAGTVTGSCSESRVHASRVRWWAPRGRCRCPVTAGP